MVKDDRARRRGISALRGVAAFLAGFSLLGLIARARHGSFDPNTWWIDLRAFPAIVQVAFLLLLSAALLHWSINPLTSRPRASCTIGLLGVAGVVSLVNAIVFYGLAMAGRIATPVPLPFSLILASLLGVMVIGVTLRPARLHVPTFGVTIVSCAILMPLAQIVFFGHTDYRRGADAVVVFGARAYADGRPSDALAVRTLTAVELYRKGLAARLIFSGGPGDGEVTEAQAMRLLALRHGVPADAIVLDEAGLNTGATVVNAGASLPAGSRVLAVSHAWHLPRVKLRFASAGIDCYTVPADERGKPLRKTPLLMLREVPAFWVYFLRTIVD